jgi:AAA domain
MFSRVFPSWEQIEQFKQPLTEGERCLLKFLDDNLKKDDLFQSNDLTKYNGWLIFVQPYLNGCRPDIIIFNPRIGVQIFEVKDWNLGNYSFETKKDGDRSDKVFCVSDGRGTYTKKSPVRQVEYYKEKIADQLIPQIGENFDKNIQQYGLIKTAVYFHKSTTAQAQALFESQIKDFSKFPVIGRDALSKNNLDKVIPDNYISQSRFWQKDWNKELLFWLKPPFHATEQGIPLTLNDDQKKFAKPQSGHHRVRGVAGSGKTQVLAYRASELASQGYRVLVLTYNLTLWHYIHDMVQRSPFDFDWHNLTITYFHGFCKDIFNEFEEVWPIDSGKDETLFREVVPNRVLEILSGNEYEKYDAILIDEGQDFYIEWYSMLCRFLTSRDEVVVVCDKKQNIYGTRTEWLDKRRSGVEKFDKWIELKKDAIPNVV